MTIRTLLFIEFQVLIVVAIAGLFIWRYWYQPKQLEVQRAAHMVPVAAGAPVAVPAQTVPAAPAVPTSPPVVSAPAAKPAPAPAPPRRQSLLKNGNFAARLDNWTLWRDAKTYSNALSIITVPEPSGTRTALRIENPYRGQLGVQQLARVESGGVYRLSAAVRSLAGHDTNTIFGGRVAFYLPPQPEYDIVWVTEYNQWWRRERIFTNQIDGVATIYVHLGYGNVSTTGEFTDISLEKL